MGSEYAIEAQQLTKVFHSYWTRKSFCAVDSVDLQVPRGTTYGLLGPNGAGKTTCVKMLLSSVHPTSGRAEVLDLGDGRRFLRLVDLRTSNGPDLFVYLSVTPADGQRDTFDDNFVSLGRLQGNQGNQNYEIAAGADLRRYRSVVIWCRRFTYAFGAAPLR